MTPSWYDLLGVEPDATSDEIRAAWRGAVADLDPTDRRFAVLNRAAKVLLDPERRAAYDAELSAQDDADDLDDEPADDTDDEPAEDDDPERDVGTAPAPVGLRKGTDEDEPADDPAESEPHADDPEPVVDDTTGADAPVAPRASLVTTALVGLAGVALVVIAVLAWTGSTSEAQLEDDVAAARVAAEQAVVPVLSYDATDLEAGRSAATSLLTDDFRAEYEELFDGLIQGNAAEIGAQVETAFISSAVVRADAAGDRVQVLVFFDQATTNDTSTEPRVASNQATFTMEEVDGRWLLDDIDTGFGD